MSAERLELLFVSLFPPSPATIGAQRRIEGLHSALAQRHRVTGVSLVSPEFDVTAAEQAMRAYCAEVELIRARETRGLDRRLLQVRSLISAHSFERIHFTEPGLQSALDRLLRERAYDAVTIEAPFLAHYRLRQAPPGKRTPLLLLDEHNIEHDLARQSRDASHEPLRRLYHAVNWRKIKREELAAWRGADGVIFTSADDLARARELHAGVRGEIVPNAVDVRYFQPDPALPRSDGRTVLFFGTLGYFPNQDGMLWFLREIWPLLERSHPQARLKVVGPHPTPEVLARRGPRIEVAGLVPDLRPHLAGAAVAIVPLRVGGGTRFKILEAMAMGRPVVSTTRGAEGIAYTPGQDILLADAPQDFAAAIGRVLDDPGLAGSMGAAGRRLVEGAYSWNAAGAVLEGFLQQLRGGTPQEAPLSGALVAP